MLNYLKQKQVSEGHVSLETGHTAEDLNLPHYYCLAFLVDPWMLGEVAVPELLEITVPDWVPERRPHLIDHLVEGSLMTCVCRHGHYDRIHHHISRYLQNTVPSSLEENRGCWGISPVSSHATVSSFYLGFSIIYIETSRIKSPLASRPKKREIDESC